MNRYKDMSDTPHRCEDCIHNDKEWYESPCDACCPAHCGYEPYRFDKTKKEEEENEQKNAGAKKQRLVIGEVMTWVLCEKKKTCLYSIVGEC